MSGAYPKEVSVSHSAESEGSAAEALAPPSMWQERLDCVVAGAEERLLFAEDKVAIFAEAERVAASSY